MGGASVALILSQSLQAIHLAPDAEIVMSKDFERGVVKILNKNESEMSSEEQLATICLLNSTLVEDSDSEVSVSTTQPKQSSCAMEILLKRRKLDNPVLSPASKFLSPKFILPTTNIVERLFSLAGVAFNEHRRSLLPANLEMQLFLKINSAFWDVAAVSEAVTDPLE